MSVSDLNIGPKEFAGCDCALVALSTHRSTPETTCVAQPLIRATDKVALETGMSIPQHFANGAGLASGESMPGRLELSMAS